jgi:hypothetical protein
MVALAKEILARDQEYAPGAEQWLSNDNSLALC